MTVKKKKYYEVQKSKKKMSVALAHWCLHFLLLGVWVYIYTLNDKKKTTKKYSVKEINDMQNNTLKIQNM